MADEPAAPRPVPSPTSPEPFLPAAPMSARTLGPYRLLTALGRGGMGTVWLAETAEPGFGLPAGTRVAVKEIHPHLAGVEGFARRFEREGHVGLRLRHENVVRTYGACDVAGADGSSARLLVMEVVEGQTLRAMLDELGRVPEALCRHVGRETAKGLAAIHGAGAVHRDVKPENVIVTPDHVVKLMDLGVARLKDEALRLSQTGTFVGSVLYAAPEQFLDGDDALDGRADLYALGLTLYELATGRHPFASDDLRVVMRRQIQEVARPASEVHPPISAFLDEVLRTLLEKDPARRFPTAGALAEVLAEGEASAWWTSRPQRALSDPRRPARRPRAPRESAMHGRAAEIERLREAFARARAGDGAVILLEGEAGIGKTRLVDEWLDELARLPDAVHVLVGGHPGGGVATSAGALAGAFRSHLGGDVRDEAVAPLLRAAPLLVPGFAALLRGDAPPPGVAPLSKDAVQSAFVHAARALSGERPTVILVEDLHNAPEDGLALFLSLALAATGRPLMLVGTTRPGLPDTFGAALDRSPVARRVAIGRLGPRDLAALLTEALRSERLAEDLGFRVGAKSDGNPFFVFEILRALRESGRLTKTGDGSWVRTQAIREIEIPSTVRDLVQARLSGLEEEDKDLLDVASCCGDEFDPLLVGEALGVARIPLLKRLGRLERTNRLVRSVDVRCLFDQRQVREAIYAGLSELLRREYHAALGEALVAREAAAGRPPEAADGATATAISRHMIEGARGERALPWLDRAMDHETRRGHPEGASALIQRALAVPGLLTGRRRAQASLRLSDLLETLGHVAESRPPLAEALALADADGDPVLRSDVRKSMGWADLHAGRPEAGLARLEEARDLARDAEAVPALVAALGGIGTAQRILRRHEQSVATHREELALAGTTGQRALVGTAQSHLGNALWASGRYAEAAACHREALAAARELEEPMREATAVGNLGLCMLGDGEFAAAAEHLGRQLELTRALGYRRGEAIALGNLASVERQSGRLARALALEERHLALCAEIDYARGLALGLTSRIETLLLLGDPEGALEAHARSVEACVRAGLGKLSRELDEERARIALLLGDEATALACWARRLSSVEDATDRRLALPVHLDLARHFVRGGRIAEALGHLRVAVAIAREASSARELVVPLAWLARLDPDALPEAAATLDRHAPLLDHVLRLEAQHVLAHATGDATRKVEARWLLDVLVDHAPPARQGPMVERVPLFREVRAGLDVLPDRRPG